jgi:diadenosine tetraphosphatase ApaH/serine/threonine PP2A family protein phosphatase
MRVAVLADIHGNLPALDAVLAEVEAAGADAIVLNGDMATGPMPAQTLERLAGLGAVRFCHATAVSDTAIVLVDSPVDRYRTGFAGVTEPTVVLGHTHMPFDRLADRRRFVNPGSVGMPYGTPGAHWALLGPEVVLRRTRYDADAATRAMRAAAPAYPGLEEFLAENVLTVPSDAEALAVFSGPG